MIPSTKCGAKIIKHNATAIEHFIVALINDVAEDFSTHRRNFTHSTRRRDRRGGVKSGSAMACEPICLAMNGLCVFSIVVWGLEIEHVCDAVYVVNDPAGNQAHNDTEEEK